MKLKTFTKIISNFSTRGELEPKQSEALLQAEKTFDSTPIHLKPYDKSKYEVPMKKIRKNSGKFEHNTGYALLEIEPFPRARLMRLYYNILQELQKGFPEDCIYKIFMEEQTKYHMKVVDETEDVEQLEDFFAVEVIEHAIEAVVGQL